MSQTVPTLQRLFSDLPQSVRGTMEFISISGSARTWEYLVFPIPFTSRHALLRDGKFMGVSTNDTTPYVSILDKELQRLDGVGIEIISVCQNWELN